MATIINKLTINGNKVIYELDIENRWAVDVDKIKFIGEMTTESGPLSDDWYFIFADNADKLWQAPTLSVEHEIFWRELGEKLNCKLAPRLFSSTKWATSVMFPKSLEGQEFYTIIKTENKKKSFWQKIFGSDNERIELTDNVKQLLNM